MKKNLLIFCLLFLSASAFAQKLPDVQESGLTAPENVRIDGKSTEWKDSYAAQNKRTDIFYSLANDDKNLYLVIKSGSSASTNKIMLGGITFTVNNQGKKREKDAITITYPLVPRGNRNGGRNRQGGFQNRTQLSQEQRDSAALVGHKASLATVKEIKISGIKSITDSLISIYNEYGIKTVASFDKTGALVYELAIPLNLLDLSAASGKEFVYQIKVNGFSNSNFNRGNGSNAGNGGGGNFAGRGGNGGGNFGNRAGGGTNIQDLMSPTDFWGKYTLIKK